MTMSMRAGNLLVMLAILMVISGCESSAKSAQSPSASDAPAGSIQAIQQPEMAPDMLMAMAERHLIRARGLTAELLNSNAVDHNREASARAAYVEAERYYLAFAERVGFGDDVANARLRAAEAMTMSGHAPQAIADLKKLIPAPTTTDAVKAEGLYWIGIAYLKLGDELNGELSHERLAYDYPESPWSEWAHVGGAPPGIPTPDDIQSERRSAQP